MIYYFRTCCDVIRHLRALCEFTGYIFDSPFPLRDFESELPLLLKELRMIKRLSIQNSPQIPSSDRVFKQYIAIRPTCFLTSCIFEHFEHSIAHYQKSLIACYSISFYDGYYILESFKL